MRAAEDRYVIESLKDDGTLDFTAPRPEDVRYFGMDAITGITELAMARVVFERCADVDGKLTGQNVAAWPSFIDPRWTARLKTW